MDRHTKVQWTEPARDALAQLDKKTRRMILDKVNGLANADDPRKDLGAKMLVGGIFQGYYRIRAGRFRVVYSIEECELPNGKMYCTVTITVVCVGLRKDGDRKDVYKLAEKLIRLGNKHLDTVIAKKKSHKKK